MQTYEEHAYLAFLFSALLHLALAYLFFFGFPSSFYKKQLSSAPQPIIFEILPVKDFINAPQQQKQQIAEHKEEATKITENNQPNKPEIAPEQKKPAEEKPSNSQAEDLAAAEPVTKETVEKVAPEEKKPEEIIPLKEESPKTKEAEKKIIEPPKTALEDKKKKPIAADLDSLLKNLEKSSSQQAKLAKTDKNAKSDDKKDIIDSLFDEQQELAVTVNSIIKTQIRKEWRPPLGGKNADQIKVTYHIELNSDGSVRLVRPKNKDCGGASISLCNAFIESTERAIWKASPIKHLPIEYYNAWQNIDFYFDLRAL